MSFAVIQIEAASDTRIPDSLVTLGSKPPSAGTRAPSKGTFEASGVTFGVTN